MNRFMSFDCSTLWLHKLLASHWPDPLYIIGVKYDEPDEAEKPVTCSMMSPDHPIYIGLWQYQVIGSIRQSVLSERHNLGSENSRWFYYMFFIYISKYPYIHPSIYTVHVTLL